MSMLPDVRIGDAGRTKRQLQQAESHQRDMEVAVFEHFLQARFRAECDQIDSQAAGDAMRAALTDEINLLDFGLSRANGSAAKAELVARKVGLFSDLNNGRIGRRFR